MAAPVEIEWHWINYNPGEPWPMLESRLRETKLRPDDWRRSVYVIRAASEFSIMYEKMHSPVLYIGEGNFKQRMTRHEQWLNTLPSGFPLQVAICCPRVPNNISAYKDFEAHLITHFLARYKSLPLKNQQREYPKSEYTYDKSARTAVLGPGQGKTYRWAMQPLHTHHLHCCYKKNGKKP